MSETFDEQVAKLNLIERSEPEYHDAKSDLTELYSSDSILTSDITINPTPSSEDQTKQTIEINLTGDRTNIQGNPHDNNTLVDAEKQAAKIENDQMLDDNGIFSFMTPERASELYKLIGSEGIPDLEWKFYGRRKPNDQDNELIKPSDKDDAQIKESLEQDETINTEFDFDEEFNETKTETSFVGESLRLKKRPEVGSDRKTNLSDIMSDIMKENHDQP